MPTDAQVAGGHKATINNPNSSKEAVENSKQILENEFNGGDGKEPLALNPHPKACPVDCVCTNLSVPHADDNKEKNPGNVIGGLKATTKNPNVSEEAKKNAEVCRLNFTHPRITNIILILSIGAS